MWLLFCDCAYIGIAQVINTSHNMHVSSPAAKSSSLLIVTITSISVLGVLRTVLAEERGQLIANELSPAVYSKHHYIFSTH